MSRFVRLRPTVAGWIRSPLFWILVAAAVLRTAGLAWGLPASDGWDDDGVAPRNFLVGLAQTYTPGSHFTYPPLHMFILAALTAPGWIIAILNAPSLHPHDVIAEIVRVPYMTFFAVVARIVSVAFSLATIFVVARMTQTVAGRRAGLFAAAACALNGALTYYGQYTNLDGSSLFWSVLGLWGWMRGISEHEPRHFRWAILASAAAVATKDQCYAIFLLSVPVALAGWFVLDVWARQQWRRIATVVAIWGVIATLALLLVDGALTNPYGFADRIALLVGPASRDYAQYVASWTGRLALIADLGRNTARYYPVAAVFLAGLGVLFHCRTYRTDVPRFVAGWVPLLAALSFTIAFDFVVLRNETRFYLPQFVLAAVYIGVAADVLVAIARPTWFRVVAVPGCLAVAAHALYLCLGVDAAFVADPRYDAERWMDGHIHAGDTLEVYGLNVYLPRFPTGVVPYRIGSKPLKARNPLPNVVEVLETYGAVASRNPRFIVVPGYWVNDYLEPQKVRQGGRVQPIVSLVSGRDMDARHYFGALFAGRLPYRLAHKSAYRAPVGPQVNAYESLTQTIYVFERRSGKAFAPIVTVPNPAVHD